MSRNPADTTPPVFHTTNTHFVVLDTDEAAAPDATVMVVKGQRIWNGPHQMPTAQAPEDTLWELTPVFWTKEQQEEWEMHTSASRGHLLVKGEDRARDAANELAVAVHNMNVEHAKLKLAHAHISNNFATKGTAGG